MQYADAVSPCTSVPNTCICCAHMRAARALLTFQRLVCKGTDDLFQINGYTLLAQTHGYGLDMDWSPAKPLSASRSGVSANEQGTRTERGASFAGEVLGRFEHVEGGTSGTRSYTALYLSKHSNVRRRATESGPPQQHPLLEDITIARSDRLRCILRIVRQQRHHRIVRCRWCRNAVGVRGTKRRHSGRLAIAFNP